MGKKGFLLVAVIGLSVIAFFTLVTLAYRFISEGAAPGDDTLYSYDDFQHVDSWEALNTLEDDYFLVYVYDPGGEESDLVKRDVFAFAVDYEDQIPVYFSVAPLEGAPSSVETPAFIIFENGNMRSVRSGEAGIYSLLDDAESGLIP